MQQKTTPPLFHIRPRLWLHTLYGLSFLFPATAWAGEPAVLIEGVLPKTPDALDVLQQKIQSLQKDEAHLRTDILSLQQTLAEQRNGVVDVNIELLADQSDAGPDYGILELTGTLNQVVVASYDHPVLLEKKETLPLVLGKLPLGNYELHIQATVGRKSDKWPFVLPEGRWPIEKTIHIAAHKRDEYKHLVIRLDVDKATELPRFALE